MPGKNVCTLVYCVDFYILYNLCSIFKKKKREKVFWKCKNSRTKGITITAGNWPGWDGRRPCGCATVEVLASLLRSLRREDEENKCNRALDLHTHTHTDVNIDSCSYCIQTSKINHPYGNEGVHFHQSLFSWLIVRAIKCFSRFPEAHGDVFKLTLSLELQQLFNQFIYRKLIQLFCWSIKEKCQMFDGSRFINVRIYCFSWSLHDNKLNIFSVLDYLLDKTRY